MNEDKFWQIIEDSKGNINKLGSLLNDLNKSNLIMFDRIMEKKLYDLDNPKLQEYADGSEDGFLYARGYIIFQGKDYYNSILVDLSRAEMNKENEDICYMALHLYEDKFNEKVPLSGISRETGSNKKYWKIQNI